jgi:hypothetical protein
MAKKKKHTTMAEPSSSYPRRRSVDIEEASNGYAVSGHDGNGNHQLHVAKSKSEAHKHAKKMLGLDKGIEKEIKKARDKASD